MLDAAGGDNIFADVKRQAVQATTELILARRPEIIIELRSSVATEADRRRELASWNTLAALARGAQRACVFLSRISA